MSLDDLYRELILDHYRTPRNRGELDGADTSVELNNPTCGDQLTLQMKVDGDRVADVRYSGKGCSISQASASMMTEAIKGRRLDEANDLLGRMLGMMRGEMEPDEAELGELEAVAGVRHFPVRVKCALLAWEALDKTLHHVDENESSSGGSTDSSQTN